MFSRTRNRLGDMQSLQILSIFIMTPADTHQYVRISSSSSHSHPTIPTPISVLILLAASHCKSNATTRMSRVKQLSPFLDPARIRRPGRFATLTPRKRNYIPKHSPIHTSPIDAASSCLVFQKGHIKNMLTTKPTRHLHLACSSMTLFKRSRGKSSHVDKPSRPRL